MKEIFTGLRAWVEIDTDAVIRNYELITSHIPSGLSVAAVIKADAYGHGAKKIAHVLEDKVQYFAVAMADEAVELRNSGIKKPILILGHSTKGDFNSLADYDIETTVGCIGEAKEISDFAKYSGKTVKIHIAIDTGMSRIGFPCSSRSVDEIEEISHMEGLSVTGLFSHFASSDEEDLTFARLQAERFAEMEKKLRERGIIIPVKHMCNSAASIISEFPKYNMVREGILLYGMKPSDAAEKSFTDLLSPALSFRTHVSALRELEAGTPVSYGATYVTDRKSTIATLQVGYADGYPRLLSNKGTVLIKGKRVPVVGRVCMDQMMVDVTDLKDVKIGDTATLIGSDGDEYISADEVAAPALTNNYEIVCGISKRVPRVYLKNGSPEEISRILI